MTDFSQFVAYQCRYPACQQDCIERAGSKLADSQECRECFQRRPPVLAPTTD